MILLDDEEMRIAYGTEGEYGTMERVCQAQLRKVVEQGEKLCEHGSYQLSRKAKDCPNCWNALKKEAGL